LSASRRLLFSFSTIRFVAGFRERANDALSPKEYSTQEISPTGDLTNDLVRLVTSVSVVAGKIGRKADLGKPVGNSSPIVRKFTAPSRAFSVQQARGRRGERAPAPSLELGCQSLFGGRDRSRVVAKAIDEPRHRDEVDHASNSYRQQPGDRHLPAWIPTSHHSPLYPIRRAGTASV